MVKYSDLVSKALEMLEADDDLFVQCVEELDAWNGYADGYRCYDMCELDDIYSGCTASKILQDLTEDFNIRDDYFYFSVWGLESTDDRAQLYRDNTSAGEVFDNLRDNWNNIDICGEAEFTDVMNDIYYYMEDEENEEAE